MPDDDLPDGWQWGGGEANRPLHEGGYYLHVATNTIWENQYARRYYEARVDTANYTQDRGPTKHILIINERIEDFREGTSADLDHLVTDVVDVDDRNDPEAQQRAEDEIHEKARMHMEYYT